MADNRAIQGVGRITKLFLDDTRPAPDASWTVVRSYDAFVRYITEKGVPDVISFDHDLHWEHCYPESGEFAEKVIPYDKYKIKTGYHCAKWLIANGHKLKEWHVHSSNLVGAANIEAVLSTGEKEHA
ncbi:MAG TPA: cyclic-phosphate processing receiver domain-containing protein [Terriglobales bacterium]|jgi:hypothetical protein|nr:cyclic-phosphate processing receiver domain-containing protein [Terriglobales bacterium]